MTIWGESAGAGAVGFHLTAYGGRDDKLFRGAIMQSGNPTFTGPTDSTERSQPLYNLLAKLAGCADLSDSLQCLRRVPAATMNQIINSSATTDGTNVRLTGFGPSIDGDFITRSIKKQLSKKEFVHVPIISGGELPGCQGRALNVSSKLGRGHGICADVNKHRRGLLQEPDPSVATSLSRTV